MIHIFFARVLTRIQHTLEKYYPEGKQCFSVTIFRQIGNCSKQQRPRHLLEAIGYKKCAYACDVKLIEL